MMSFSSDIDDGYTNSITGVAISNQSILILCTLGFGTLGLVILLILRHLSTDKENENEIDISHGRGHVTAVDINKMDNAFIINSIHKGVDTKTIYGIHTIVIILSHQK